MSARQRAGWSRELPVTTPPAAAASQFAALATAIIAAVTPPRQHACRATIVIAGIAVAIVVLGRHDVATS